jgi:hypothetical protein
MLSKDPGPWLNEEHPAVETIVAVTMRVKSLLINQVTPKAVFATGLRVADLRWRHNGCPHLKARWSAPCRG